MSNFTNYINDYTENLDSVLSKLKKNTKDLELSNKIKEEINNLKYRIQMLSIDKNDDYRNVETELSSIKTVYTNEINSMLRYMNELGFDNIPIEHIAPNNLTTDKITNFFSLVKRIMKQLKDDVKEKDEQIKMINKYKDNKDNIDKIEQKLLNNTEYKAKINNEYSKYNTQNSFNTLNNNERLLNTINSNNIMNSNNNSSNNISNKRINNDRIKKIEDLCLQHNYEDENKNSEINNKNTYQIISNQDAQKSQSYFDNFQRSKNMTNNESNISLGVQLEHNYTDSYFYQNMKDSFTNNNINLDNINKMDKDYFSKINQHINQ